MHDASSQFGSNEHRLLLLGRRGEGTRIHQRLRGILLLLLLLQLLCSSSEFIRQGLVALDTIVQFAGAVQLVPDARVHVFIITSADLEEVVGSCDDLSSL